MFTPNGVTYIPAGNPVYGRAAIEKNWVQYYAGMALTSWNYCKRLTDLS